MIEGQTQMGPESSGKALFGTQALESEPTIEAIWASPAPSSVSVDCKHSSPLVGLAQLTGRTYAASDMKVGGDATMGFMSNTSTPREHKESSGRTIARHSGRAIAAVREEPANAPPMKLSKGRHPPLSYSHYQWDPYIVRRQSSATSTLQGLEAIHRASTSLHYHDSEDSGASSYLSLQSEDASRDLQPISASAPNLFTGRRVSESITQPGPLDVYRASQVAETGQLAPRGRNARRTDSAESSQSVMLGVASRCSYGDDNIDIRRDPVAPTISDPPSHSRLR